MLFEYRNDSCVRLTQIKPDRRGDPGAQADPGECTVGTVALLSAKVLRPMVPMKVVLDIEIL